MPESNHDVSRLVLQLCAAKGPDGLFYPRVDAAGLDVDRSLLDAALDRLRLGGFVEIGDWTQQQGQGYRLTEAGELALHKPEYLQRSAAPRLRVVSVPNDRWEQADEVRRAVMEPPTAIVTRILVAVNVAVFVLVGAYNMYLDQTLNDVLNGRMYQPGALAPILFFSGEWWLLLTYQFLHGGLFHIGMNMYCLFSLGNVMEGRWGWKRYLVLYFGSGIVGGIAVLYSQSNVVGASGAICGLIASLGVWAWMHREYLPPHFVQAHFRVVGINMLLIVGSGFALPNISTSCHVGGAIGGALLSIPLAWLGPFSPLRHRVIGVASLVLIAAAGLLAIAMAPRPDPDLVREVRELRQR